MYSTVHCAVQFTGGMYLILPSSLKGRIHAGPGFLGTRGHSGVRSRIASLLENCFFCLAVVASRVFLPGGAKKRGAVEICSWGAGGKEQEQRQEQRQEQGQVGKQGHPESGGAGPGLDLRVSGWTRCEVRLGQGSRKEG